MYCFFVLFWFLRKKKKKKMQTNWKTIGSGIFFPHPLPEKKDKIAWSQVSEVLTHVLSFKLSSCPRKVICTLGGVVNSVNKENKVWSPTMENCSLLAISPKTIKPSAQKVVAYERSRSLTGESLSYDLKYFGLLDLWSRIRAGRFQALEVGPHRACVAKHSKLVQHSS